MKNVRNSSRGRSQGVMDIFRVPYRAHCAVIFATAQLSCFTCDRSLRQSAVTDSAQAERLPQAMYCIMSSAMCEELMRARDNIFTTMMRLLV